MMGHWDGGWNVGNWLLMGLVMLLFWTVVVAGVMWLVRSVSAGQHRYDRSETSKAGPKAREILDERYARGEVSNEEYRTLRDNLASR